MRAYQLLLFVHISAVILWLGSELYAHILAVRAERRADTAALEKLFHEVNSLDHILMPVGFAVPVTGILMVIDGPWSFGDRWIILGLSGFGLVLLYGFSYLQPQVNRARAMIERDGRMGAECQVVVRRFFVLWRIETVLLFAVVFGMTAKPHDIATLSSMAGVVVVASAYLLRRARSMGTSPFVARG